MLFAAAARPIGTPYRIGGLELEQQNVSSATSRFDLTVTCEDAKAGLIVAFEYSADLFDPATIDRMAEHYGRLLAHAVRRPETTLATLPIVTADEATTLLRTWNASATAYPAHRSVHELFEECAASTPDATAVVAGGRSLTYGELNAHANRLARRLRTLGVATDQAVAVAAERTPAMVVALVAVLKAGGCYLPFDPADPAERLEFSFRQAGVRLMISPTEAGPRLPQGTGATWVPVELDDPALLAGPSHNLNLQVPARQPWPTSPSPRDRQGRPTRASASRIGPWCGSSRDTNYLAYGPDLRILELAPVSFDASTFELWGALCNGAVLVVFRPGPPSITGDLAQAIIEHRITSLYLTSALFNLMVDERPEALRRRAASPGRRRRPLAPARREDPRGPIPASPSSTATARRRLRPSPAAGCCGSPRTSATTSRSGRR